MIAMVLEMSHDAMVATAWVAACGFTSVTIIIGSLIGARSTRHDRTVRAATRAKELEVETLRIQQRTVSGPLPEDVMEMADAEDKLAKAIERRVKAQDKARQRELEEAKARESMPQLAP